MDRNSGCAFVVCECISLSLQTTIPFSLHVHPHSPSIIKLVSGCKTESYCMAFYILADPLVDGNGDGIADMDQGDVVSTPGFLSGSILTAVGNSGLTSVSSAVWSSLAAGPATLLDGSVVNIEFPLGSFKLNAANVDNAER